MKFSFKEFLQIFDYVTLIIILSVQQCFCFSSEKFYFIHL